VVQIRAAGRTDSGEPPAIALVHRIRERYLPAAGFPAGADVLLSGAPAFGVDFVDRAYGAFPWLVLAVLFVSSASESTLRITNGFKVSRAS
jgi:hypothetical protein